MSFFTAWLALALHPQHRRHDVDCRRLAMKSKAGTHAIDAQLNGGDARLTNAIRGWKEKDR